jgi:anaerobic selenocysteine-containing dehydrogenase
MMKHVIERDDRGDQLLDLAFIAEHTTGFASLAADLRAESWAVIEEESGLSEAQIRAVGDVYAKAERSILCWGMGITQHRDSVATIQMLVNLLLLRGNIGRPGAGPCPVRGHSNVQGDRTMGIWEKPPASFLAALSQRFGSVMPQKHGLDVVDSIRAMHAGKVRVFFALGGNFLSATPDTELTAEALARCKLTVHVSTKLNRAHLVTGERALILPCLGRSEVDL